jgi:biotin operon repressor
VRSSPGPLSANAIAATIGGRKANVLHLVRQLVSEGVLVATSDGFTLP